MELSKSFPKILILLVLFSNNLLAQPANDDCENAIVLTEVAQWCSGIDGFSNESATPSGYDAATCFNNASDDVWFLFTAVATDLTLTINGNQINGPGGTLNNPEVALYIGTCGGIINQLACDPNMDQEGAEVVELYKGGLVVGETYLIRVQGASGAQGTFELCINNYNQVAQPGSDCITSAVLCDKSSFTVQQVNSAGNDNNEAAGTCLGGGPGSGIVSESNSTWFTWICDDSGPLTFSLTPLNPPDDLDFVVYELPNGIDDCSGKIPLLCMASGLFEDDFPNGNCFGATGLSSSSTDTVEDPGCEGNSDNFIAPLDMVAGRAYALLVNNFSQSGSGFNIDFGGSGTFQGPEASYEAVPAETVCYGETITFNDNSFAPQGSSIVDWDWAFGAGATPSEASGAGPHDVTWSSPGMKSIVLTVRSDLGCIITEIDVINIETCCEDENAMVVTPEITNLECAEIEDGIVDIAVSSNVPPYTFEWSTGATTEDISDLGLGDYTVTITNDATCDTILTYTIDGPSPIDPGIEVEMPTCNGGSDGGITLNTSGGVPGYMYSWEGAPFSNDNELTDLPIGFYDVIIRDANGCELPLTIEVDELELILDANVPIVFPPSCDDSTDGSIVVSVANGTGPFEYNWNDGFGWGNVTAMNGLNNGTYILDFRDANGCLGRDTLELVPPEIVTADIAGIDISCFEANDGIASVTPGGGVGNYTYRWQDGQTDSVIVNLVPGTYAVTVFDGNLCDAVASVTIVEPPDLFIDLAGIEDNLCYGDSSGVVHVVGSGGTPPFTYSIDGLEFQVDTSFVNLLSGSYQVIIEDAMGCQDSVMATINQPPELIADAGPDQTVDLGYSVILNGSVIPPFWSVDYLWSDSITINCPECPRTNATPPNPTVYTLTLTDENGCTATDDVFIDVVKNRPVYIPNVFSPNADGFNDYFTAFAGPAAREILLLRVFNRWGALVYEAKNIPVNADLFGWDGRFKEQYVTPGVFAYYIVIDFIDDEEVEYKGSISVVR